MRRRRFEQVLIACSAFEDRWGQTAALLWLKATASIEQGDHEAAETLLRKYLCCDPRSVEATKRLAKLLRVSGRGVEAIAVVESFSGYQESDELLAELAENHLQAGNSDLAILHAHQALERYHECLQALMVLGAAFVFLGAPAQALKQLEAARRLSPSNPQVHINIAAAHALQGDRDQRIASLETALLCEGSMLSVRQILAGLYMEAGDAAAAKAQWEAMQALGDHSLETRLGLSSALRLLGDVRGAVDILLEHVSQQGDDLQVWHELADCYVLLADDDRARRVAERMLRLEPRNNVALRLLEQLNCNDSPVAPH